jgi:hypothetical protein
MSSSHRASWVVIGAGLFGLYAALVLRRRGEDVLVVEADDGPMLRASLVNQARLHSGYHYPRSVFTALRSASYSRRFAADFPDAVDGKLRKLYAVAARGSVTDADAFVRFCASMDIPLRQADPRPWLHADAVAGVWETDETTFDAARCRKALLGRLEAAGGVDWLFRRRVVTGERLDDGFRLRLSSGEDVYCNGVVNATYAGTNQLLTAMGFEPLPLKYELAEVALGRAGPLLSGVGITVMDGPFFSVMPFGKTGLHSLTAVDYTPRAEATGAPVFSCQSGRADCSSAALANCTPCPVRPATAFPLMRKLSLQYLDSGIALDHAESLFTVKAVLTTTEVDDARPTLVVRNSESPVFVTVFSGKISTVYDLEGAL